MTMENEKRLVWLDMEMTGLNPDHDRILEVALIVTDEFLAEIGDPFVMTVFQEEYVLGQMNAWCQTHHAESGLVDAVRGASLRCGEVESNIITWLKGMGFGPQTAVIAGNTIHFDRRFIARWMPDLHQYLHYRLFDVTSIREAVQRWFPEEHPVRKLAEKKGDLSVDDDDHRALSDIRTSITECQRYANVFEVMGEWTLGRTHV